MMSQWSKMMVVKNSFAYPMTYRGYSQVGILGSEGGVTGSNPLRKPSPSSNSHCSSQSKPTKHVSEAIKAPKSSTFSTATVPPVNATQSLSKEIKSTPVSQPPQLFDDLFGTSIKANKASPDPQKVKDSHTKNSSKSNKPTTSSSFPNEQQPLSNSSSSKDSKSIFSKETKDPKDSKREKSSVKRPLSPVLPTSDSSHTKKKKTAPSSISSCKSKDVKDKKKSEKKSASKDKEKKEKREKHKHANQGGAAKHLSGERKTSEGKSNKESDGNPKVIKKSKPPPSASPSMSNSSVSSEATKSSRSFKISPPSPQLCEESLEPGGISPSSSISLSPMHHSRGNGPLGLLMAAYEDGNILSPMSSDSSSGPPPHTLQEDLVEADMYAEPSSPPPQSPPSPKPPSPPPVQEKIEKPKVKEEKTKVIKEGHSTLSRDGIKRSKSKGEKLPLNSAIKKVKKISAKEHASREPTPESLSDEYATELKELQKQIMMLRDRKHLQQIVTVIEETGLYQLTSTTFDFDLCRLDRGTVIKLQNCLAAVV